MNADADLVVVGGGPRALYALADLEKALAADETCATTRPRVVVLEPATPGAGAVWDPSQPSHLRMNVHAQIVDATCPSVPLTFHEWLEQERAAETFPPRALAGRYLAWAFARLATSRWLDVTHRAVRVTEVRSEGPLWVCETADATGAVAAPLTSARVLLATGHAGGVGLDHAAIASTATGPAPGETVLVHGAALTAFDVVLDLTAGRGGLWVDDPSAESGLQYVPGGTEPSSITLVSRSGEPMLPKPISVPTSVTAAVRARTGRWLPDAVPDDAWWAALADAAAAAAFEAGHVVTRDQLWERLEWAVARQGAADEDLTARWTRDMARAQGDVDADPAWWWGRAWAAGYADVVRSLERGPRDAHSWPRWRERAAVLERWAFGPPLATHRRLLALREAGLLRVVPGRRQALAGDTEISAFTRGPGVLDSPRPWAGEDLPASRLRAPWDGLIASGVVTVRAGERGVLTRPDGACVDRDGEVACGLTALGRPTEDPVIGHDSLQRHLHDDSRRWARAFAREWASVGSAREAAAAHG